MSQMKTKNLLRLLRNLGTSFYKSIFLKINFAHMTESIAVIAKVRY
ncbi:hypothetical protein EU94_0826 [Prochlorococcus marinus str. MIT 9123]|nr:hypothetical protein EU94_0826 [Prochlorococcus marinus str. MIT 9123]